MEPKTDDDPGVAESLTLFWRGRFIANPIVVLWRWRYELAILLLAVGTVAIFVSRFGAGPAAVGVASLLGALFSSHSTRLWLTRRAWLIITPHRVRVGLSVARLRSRSNRPPSIIRTSLTEHGERVMLWLRPGLVFADVVAAQPLLAAATWSREVRVSAYHGRANLVALDVIRSIPSAEEKGTAQGYDLSEKRQSSPRARTLRRLGRAFRDLLIPRGAREVLVADPSELAADFTVQFERELEQSYARLGPPPGFEGQPVD